MHRWIVLVLAFAVVAAAALYAGGFFGPEVTRHQPTAVRLLGEGGDPPVLPIVRSGP